MNGKEIDFADLSDGWVIETSGEGETANLFDNRVVLTAGGYESFTHYARVRQKEFPIGLDEPFTIQAKVELPKDFYTQQTDYFRLLGADNFPVAVEGHTWRIGLVIFSDHLPALVVQHRFMNPDERVIWKGDQRLQTGEHIYSLSVNASRNNPITEFYIDGVKIASSKAQNVPDGLQEAEQGFYRYAYGIDGASGYGEGESLSLTLHSAKVFYGTGEGKGCFSFLRTR